jgi:hypothetical protein
VNWLGEPRQRHRGKHRRGRQDDERTLPHNGFLLASSHRSLRLASTQALRLLSMASEARTYAMLMGTPVPADRRPRSVVPRRCGRSVCIARRSAERIGSRQFIASQAGAPRRATRACSGIFAPGSDRVRRSAAHIAMMEDEAVVIGGG